MSGPNDGLKVKKSFLRSIKPFLDLPSIYPSFIQDIGIIAEAHRFEVTSWDSFINLLISFIRHEDVRSDEGAPLLPVISWCLAKARGHQTSDKVKESFLHSIKPFLDLPSTYPSFIQDIGTVAEAHRFEVTSWDSFINLLISFIRHEDVRSDEGTPLLPVISWCLAKARDHQTYRIVSNSSAVSSTLPNNESPSLSVFSRNEVKEGNTSDLIDRTSSKPLSSATLDAMNTHGTKGGLGRQRGSSREISPTPSLPPSYSRQESLTSPPTEEPLTQRDPPQTQLTLESARELISRFLRIQRSPSPASTVGSKRFRKEDEPSTSHGSPSVHQLKGKSPFNQPSRPPVAAPGVSSGKVTKALRRVAPRARPSGALPRVLAAGPPKAAPKILKGGKVGCKSALKGYLDYSDSESCSE